MERRDYLETQIEQLALVLANIFGMLTGNKVANSEASDDSVSQALKEELGFNIDGLIDIGNDEFIDSLNRFNKFDSENFERLADILFLLAGQSGVTADDFKTRNLYSKALLLYKYLEQQDKMYSMQRDYKINKILEQIDIQ